MRKDAKFYIELLGLWPTNRGSELMARATIQEIRAVFPNAKFCSRVKVSEETLRNLDVYPVPKREKRGERRLTKLILKVLRRGRDDSFRQPSYILDISGFAYGDFWGSEKSFKRLGSNLKTWEKNNIPLIILPQAFGSFTGANFIDCLKPSLDYASVIHPRDQQSYDYLKQDLSIDASICPDITFAFDSYTQVDMGSADYCVFVPNSKMVVSKEVSRGSYIQLFEKWIQMAAEANIRPVLLCHEGEEDLKLCREMAQGNKCEVIMPTNALEIKGILKKATFVVTSRYHALISAITFSAPVIAYGWTHKYEEVMKQFEIEHLLMRSEPNQDPVKFFRQVLDPEIRSSTSAKISGHLSSVRQQVQKMWQSVICIMLTTK